MKNLRLVGIVSVLIGVACWLCYTAFWTRHDFPFVWLPITMFISIGITSLIWPWWVAKQQNGIVDDLLIALFPERRAIHWAITQVCLAISLFLFGVVFWRWDLTIRSSMWKTAVISSLIGLSIIIGLRSLRLILLHDDKSYITVRDLLKKHLKNLVWVYDMPLAAPSDNSVTMGDNVAVYAWLEQGDVYRFMLSRAMVDPFFAFLRDAAPQATIGYNLELAERYQDSVET